MICVGGGSYYAVYLYGLSGMVCGSSHSTFPGVKPCYDFTCNILSVLMLFHPLIIVLFLFMIGGMILGTVEFYHSDKDIKRIMFLIISLIPSMGFLLVGMISASQYGLWIDDISLHMITGTSAILPWTVWYIGQFWYLQLIPLFVYPLSIRKKQQ